MPTPNLLQALDARGRRSSPASITGYKPRRPPATKGRRYDPDPLPVEDVARLLAACTPQRPGQLGERSALRLRTLLILLWRTGMRISEALALEERDLDERSRTILIRRGKGGKRRTVMMDAWGWEQLRPWLAVRLELPPGQIFCVLTGPTAGREIYSSEVRRQIRDLRARSGVRRRVCAHGMRHSFAADLRREGNDLLTICAQLGHADLRVTQVYLRGLPLAEVLEPVSQRKPPMIPLQ